MTQTSADVSGIQDVMTLSPLQQGLFALAMASEAPSDDPYTMAIGIDVTGPLDSELLRDCVVLMLKRHPNVRARFVGRVLPHPVQVVPVAVDLAFEHVTATGESAVTLESEERAKGFDLEKGPPIRFLLIELSDVAWRFHIAVHHIVIDGWSMVLFIDELLRLYQSGGNLDALPSPPRPYRDYLSWLARRDVAQSEELWRQYLAGLPGPTLLAAESPGGNSVQPGGEATYTVVRLDAAATSGLVHGARTRGVTVSTLTQLAWALLLSAHTGSQDVVFGVTVSTRPAELTGVESMVGLLINTVPMRVSLEPTTLVGSKCALMQRDGARLREHAYLGHAQIRSLAGLGELFDTVLAFENFPLTDSISGGGWPPAR
ncbi:Linear gramicidin synthase subunit D [Mycobacterium basiliense]|uniref:Linear gramicidin synthase subunit D n=1 Tax=Mycobacterium basiliense TaxID=2094119 RepID=A0A447GAN4_9MYCO|nr:condensation domain-containing protein [Mycobacterium basiliense]VDM87524.1 Linear gramicidin synthase subunit D [Mycobacterium basiliense]